MQIEIQTRDITLTDGYPGIPIENTK